MTLRTIEYAFGYEPGAYIGLISPTPLLLIVAVKDHLAVSDLAIAAYERALEPKRLVLLPGGHFEAYVEAFDQSSGQPATGFAPTLDDSLTHAVHQEPAGSHFSRNCRW